jgi:ATP-binding cassette, subfamily F, member 3
MPLLVVADLTKSYGGLPVLAGTSFALEPGEKVGLVGRNGVGKTTVLRLLAGLDTADGGTFSVRSGAVVAYLPQEPDVDPTHTLWEEAAAAFSSLTALERHLADAERRMAAPEVHGDTSRLGAALEAYGRLRDQFETQGGFTYEAEIRRTLRGLDFTEDQFPQPLASMSGGQLARAALARILLSAPDLLLLDEPTNHLDLDALEWLQSWLGEYRGALLLVSHDRYLLDAVTTRTLDLEGGHIVDYPGNYAYFVTERNARRERQQETFERQQEEIASLKEYIRRHRAGQKSRQAKSREKRLARIEPLEAPRVHRTLSFRLDTPRRTPQVVLRFSHVTKRFGPTEVLRDVTLALHRGEKAGLIGPNGAGKTTLLRLAVGQDAVTAGSVELGTGVRVGYFTQHAEEMLDLSQTVLEEVLGGRPVTPEQVRTLLGRFLFSGDAVHKKVGQLSGGERRRVALAKLVLDRPDLLLLDEPTTHLDLLAMEALEAGLHTFPGAMILVTHDRYLLDRVTSRLLVLRDGTLTAVPGSYHSYREAVASPSAASGSARESQPRDGNPRTAPQRVADSSREPAERASRREPRGSQSGAQRTHEGGRGGAKRRPSRASGSSADDIITRIGALEQELKDLSRLMGDPELYRDAVRARQTLERYEEVNTTLESLYAALDAADGEAHA